MVCCRQRLSSGWVTEWNIRSGFGSVSVVDANICLTGTLGEGPAGFLREGWFFRVVSFGDNVLGSPCASVEGVIGRVSDADASLSLSGRVGV